MDILNDVQQNNSEKSRICVFGAASDEINECFKQDAYLLGKTLAKRNHILIFGGGAEGVMGCVSKGAYENGGTTMGIAPSYIQNFQGLASYCDIFIYTKRMEERKYLFKKYSDAFILAPGGFGTLDECFDILLMKRLYDVNKPIIIFNSNNFYDKLLEVLEHLKDTNTLPEEYVDFVDIAYTVDDIFEILKNYGLTY